MAASEGTEKGAVTVTGDSSLGNLQGAQLISGIGYTAYACSVLEASCGPVLVSEGKGKQWCLRWFSGAAPSCLY